MKMVGMVGIVKIVNKEIIVKIVNNIFSLIILPTKKIIPTILTILPNYANLGGV